MRGASAPGQPGGPQGGGSKKAPAANERRFVLTVDDLALALADQGITLKKPPYYV